jgi:hypothetical protein
MYYYYNMSKKNKKNIYKSEECVVCFYNILEHESYCYCSKCKIHSHLSCLEEWNEKNPNEEGVCCHCRQEGYLVKELIPSCGCCGYLLFIRKKTN